MVSSNVCCRIRNKMLEKIIGRRDILKLGAVAAATTAFYAALNPTPAEPVQKHFPTRSVVFDTNSLKEVFLDDSLTTKPTFEEKREIQALLNEALAQYPSIRLTSPEPEFTKRRWVKFEPDVKYANDLATHSAASIDDIFDFLNSPYFQNPGIQTIVPRDKHDIKFSGYDKIPLYLIADHGQRSFAVFDINILGIPQPPLKIERSYHENFAAESERPSTVYVSNGEVKISQILGFPIFYNTSSDLVSRIEAPAIEALHKVISGYAHKHLARDFQLQFKSPNFSLEKASEVFRKSMEQEERFVHALSIPWLEHYNKKTGYATSNDLKARFKLYEQKGSVYNGANRLAVHIARIGIQKAIERYVTNPNELFNGAGIT